MSSLTDWSNETEKCIASRTTFEYPAGQMIVEFRTYLFEHNYGINSVKRLLKISNAENRAVMLRTVEILIDQVIAEYQKVMDDAEKSITEISNKYMFEWEREKAKAPIIKRRDAKRKSLSNSYKKLLKIEEEIEGWNVNDKN